MSGSETDSASHEDAIDERTSCTRVQIFSLSTKLVLTIPQLCSPRRNLSRMFQFRLTAATLQAVYVCNSGAQAERDDSDEPVVI